MLPARAQTPPIQVATSCSSPERTIEIGISTRLSWRLRRAFALTIPQSSGTTWAPEHILHTPMHHLYNNSRGFCIAIRALAIVIAMAAGAEAFAQTPFWLP